MIRNVKLIALGVFVVMALMASSCANKYNQSFEFTPYVNPFTDIESDDIANYFDEIGCPDNEPSFLDGGHNYCTPESPDQIARYKEAGIIMKGDPKYDDCMPFDHVFFGGKCLKTPNPGNIAYNYFVLGVKPGKETTAKTQNNDQSR